MGKAILQNTRTPGDRPTPQLMPSSGPVYTCACGGRCICVCIKERGGAGGGGKKRIIKRCWKEGFRADRTVWIIEKQRKCSLFFFVHAVTVDSKE